MKTPSPELIELCGAVRDETATPEQIVRLEALLTVDAEARRFYRRFIHVRALLERYEQPPAAVRETPTVASARRWRWSFRCGRHWLALAACVVPSAKIVRLAFGQVSCDVAKQPEGMRWRIVTTDGEVTVLGTRLAVNTGGNGTRVAVTAGLVRVTSCDSRESVETPAGYATDLTPTTAIRSKRPATAN